MDNGRKEVCLPWSRPARGAWIEINTLSSSVPLNIRRAPHGARGLKCLSTGVAAPGMRSRPARGAWIEIYIIRGFYLPVKSRPARGAWIEIARTTPPGSAGRLSRPARGAWIEIKEILAYGIKDLSRPARGAWIEMCRARKASALRPRRAPHGARGLK